MDRIKEVDENNYSLDVEIRSQKDKSSDTESQDDDLNDIEIINTLNSHDIIKNMNTLKVNSIIFNDNVIIDLVDHKNQMIQKLDSYINTALCNIIQDLLKNKAFANKKFIRSSKKKLSNFFESLNNLPEENSNRNKDKVTKSLRDASKIFDNASPSNALKLLDIRTPSNSSRIQDNKSPSIASRIQENKSPSNASKNEGKDVQASLFSSKLEQLNFFTKKNILESECIDTLVTPEIIQSKTNKKNEAGVDVEFLD